MEGRDGKNRRLDRRAVSLRNAVVDSSVLIGLEHIGHVDLLRLLFEQVTVPAAVRDEVAPPTVMPEWIRIAPLESPVPDRISRAKLGPGESACIALVMETDAAWLLLDDLAARRFAESLGLPVMGELGILRTAKKLGHIDALAPLASALREHGFRLSTRLLRVVLEEVGER